MHNVSGTIHFTNLKLKEMEKNFSIATKVASYITNCGGANFGLSLDICRCFDYNDVNYNVTRSEKTASAKMFGGINTKTPLSIKKRYSMRNFGVGKNVVRVLAQRLNQQRVVDGLEPFSMEEIDEYNLSSPTGFEYVKGFEGILLRSTKNPDRYALRVYPNNNVEYNGKGYYIGNSKTEERVATEEEITTLKGDLREKKDDYSKKQEAYGIKDKKLQLKFRTIYIDNILSVSDGKVRLQVRECGVK